MRLKSHRTQNSEALGNDVLFLRTDVFKYTEILHLFLQIMSNVRSYYRTESNAQNLSPEKPR